MLTASLVHGILGQLLDPNDVKVNAEAVCLLLGTSGKELDYKTCVLLETYASWLKDVLTTHPQLETRLKFMIHDLLDLQANNWVNLRHNKVKDKTISELISASEAEVLSRLHPGASTNTNTRNRRAVQFHPINRPDPPPLVMQC
ncbi:hypothetical protein MKX01_009597 [Papaver californicum]|nr:hypothetical protein MKX01_009597 [Papaver californicum]